MRVAFFEDFVFEDPAVDVHQAAGLGPIALTRPVFELVCGRFTLRERILRCGNVTEWGAFIRPQLAEMYREQHPQTRVNDLAWLHEAPTLLINGRWLPSAESLEHMTGDEANVVGQTVVSLLLDPLEAPLLTEQGWNDSLAQMARTRQVCRGDGPLVQHPWDLVNHNPRQLCEDFRFAEPSGHQVTLPAHVALLGSPEHLSVDPSAEIEPFVVLDVREGPISIDAGAVVGAYTHIKGPAHVGESTQLFRADVKGGTTIGPVCRIGGEIETSILHGHANKYHLGFLGHSYVCPWVNMGALTTNSDLKNDYSSVSVPLAGNSVATGHPKVGCFIGDHTKTAIGSLINTGSSIGVLCMVLPGGELLPKHIPSFSKVWHGCVSDEFNFEQALGIVRASMGRRDCELTAAHENLLRVLYQQTTAERTSAVNRSRAKSQPGSFTPRG